jgi:hypothetical protein
MSRIATITAAVCLAAAPTALGSSGIHNINDIGKQSPPAVHATAGQDLRSPDAADVFAPTAPAAHVTTADAGGGLSTWGYLAIVAGALVAFALLGIVLRRAFAFGRPVGV